MSETTTLSPRTEAFDAPSPNDGVEEVVRDMLAPGDDADDAEVAQETYTLWQAVVTRVTARISELFGEQAQNEAALRNAESTLDSLSRAKQSCDPSATRRIKGEFGSSRLSLTNAKPCAPPDSAIQKARQAVMVAKERVLNGAARLKGIMSQLPAAQSAEPTRGGRRDFIIDAGGGDSGGSD